MPEAPSIVFVEPHRDKWRQMIKAVAKFWGQDRDQFGMPEPYNSYLVISSPWETKERGIASVVPISGNARLSKAQFLAERGGERAAFESAVASLQGEVSNTGLRFELQED